jgi:hypothetical protein
LWWLTILLNINGEGMQKVVLIKSINAYMVIEDNGGKTTFSADTPDDNPIMKRIKEWTDAGNSIEEQETE